MRHKRRQLGVGVKVAVGEPKLEQQRDKLTDEENRSDLLVLLRALRFAEGARFDVGQCSGPGIHAGAAREASALARQFLQIAKAEGLATGSREADPEAVQRCILAGFPDQVALRVDAGTLRCNLVHGRKGVLARESVAQDTPLLVACEVREVDGRGVDKQVLLTLATAVREEWLREMFPGGFEETTDVFFDSVQRRVLAKQVVRFRDLLLRSKETDRVPQDAAAAKEWFLKAADKGHPGSQYALGMLYTRGEGVVADQERALEWFRRAARNGHVDAQIQLGGILAGQPGAPPDVQEEALFWLGVAIDKLRPGQLRTQAEAAARSIEQRLTPGKFGAQGHLLGAQLRTVGGSDERTTDAVGIVRASDLAGADGRSAVMRCRSHAGRSTPAGRRPKPDGRWTVAVRSRPTIPRHVGRYTTRTGMRSVPGRLLPSQHADAADRFECGAAAAPGSSV